MTEPIRNEWVEQFDVFISYARADNAAEPKMVSAFVAKLEIDFAAFSPAVPLSVFFDKTSILDGQIWQEVLRKGWLPAIEGDDRVSLRGAYLQE